MSRGGIGDELGRILGPESRRSVHVHDSERGRTWTLVEMLSTGQLRRVETRAGEAIYTADIPVLHPRIIRTCASLDELAAAEGRDAADETSWQQERREYEQQVSERDRELLHALGTSLAGELVQAARMSGTREDSSDPGRACGNCEGRGGGEWTCDCREEGRHHLGLVADADDLILEEAQEADRQTAAGFNPDCARCHGSGRSHWTCPICHGSGRLASRIEWHISGDGGSIRIPADARQLLARGLADVTVSGYGGNRFCDVSARLDLRDLYKAIDDSCCDGQTSWQQHGTAFRGWDQAISANTGWRLTLRVSGEDEDTNEAILGQHDGLECRQKPPRRAVRRSAQERTTGGDDTGGWVSVSQARRALGDIESILDALDADMLPAVDWTGKTVSIQVRSAVRRDEVEMLDSLVSRASAAGASIALRYGFIATGQEGPHVLLAATDGRMLTELGLDWDWPGALASASCVLDGALERARAAGLL